MIGGMMELYHGSRQIITLPDLSHSRTHNDYGPGFYCTGIHALAGEWACRNGTNGFINHYLLDTDGLTILDLSKPPYTSLHWIALLLKNRKTTII